MKKNCKRCQIEFEFGDKNSFFSDIIGDWLCGECKESLDYQLAAFKRNFIQTKCKKREDLNSDFFPPPWDFVKHPEKTEGWIEFQKEMRKHPEYYYAEEG